MSLHVGSMVVRILLVFGNVRILLSSFMLLLFGSFKNDFRFFADESVVVDVSVQRAHESGLRSALFLAVRTSPSRRLANTANNSRRSMSRIGPFHSKRKRKMKKKKKRREKKSNNKMERKERKEKKKQKTRNKKRNGKTRTLQNRDFFASTTNGLKTKRKKHKKTEKKEKTKMYETKPNNSENTKTGKQQTLHFDLF